MASTSRSTTKRKETSRARPANRGRSGIYRVSDGQFMSQFMIPRPQAVPLLLGAPTGA